MQALKQDFYVHLTHFNKILIISDTHFCFHSGSGNITSKVIVHFLISPKPVQIILILFTEQLVYSKFLLIYCYNVDNIGAVLSETFLLLHSYSLTLMLCVFVFRGKNE